jgi:2-hydroxychromene-2-carboxylate isomerase
MSGSAAIDFYFDFSSPYGYLMSEKIDDLAARHGRAVQWRPVLLGPVLKATGAVPLTQAPLKGDYSRRDFVRSARFLGVPFTQPLKFPIATQVAARAYYWMGDQDHAVARSFARTLFRAYFTELRDISEPAVVLELAAKAGIDDAALKLALTSTELKDHLRAEVDAALARGVCGSPYVIIDGEPFLGVDRLPQIECWLANGGF